jgi:hypothetical protein
MSPVEVPLEAGKPPTGSGTAVGPLSPARPPPSPLAPDPPGSDPAPTATCAAGGSGRSGSNCPTAAAPACAARLAAISACAARTAAASARPPAVVSARPAAVVSARPPAAARFRTGLLRTTPSSSTATSPSSGERNSCPRARALLANASICAVTRSVPGVSASASSASSSEVSIASRSGRSAPHWSDSRPGPAASFGGANHPPRNGRSVSSLGEISDSLAFSDRDSASGRPEAETVT